jgi:hypothetical protein
MKAWWLCLPLVLVFGSASQRGSAEPLRMLVHTGMCDASAAVALDADHFAVANDEDNPIRVFRSETGGRPITTCDLTRFLNINPKQPELDLEGATWLNDHIFWITSHGRNREGKVRANRHFLFATQVRQTTNQMRLVPFGRPYRSLLRDLLKDQRLAAFRLDLASQRPPKAKDALNIEGLCGTPDGRLLVAFRNPIPQGRALIVPMLNPLDVINGKPAQLGPPILLDLAGLGIRDMTSWRGKFLIVAGSYDGGGQSALYVWDGENTTPSKLPSAQVQNFNPEAVIAYPDGREAFQLLSDDGTRLVGREPCKKAKNPADRSFRSVWVVRPKE